MIGMIVDVTPEEEEGPEIPTAPVVRMSSESMLPPLNRLYNVAMTTQTVIKIYKFTII